MELRYQFKVQSEDERTEIKIALLRLKNYTKCKNISGAILAIAKEIEEKKK